jgi:Cu-Zn family superoxide dismutase
MMRKFCWLALVCAACASTPEPDGTYVGSVNFINTTGQPAGTATVSAVGDGIRIVANLPGLPAGQYGFHIHTTGKCNGPAFDTAGPHYNPTGKQHGTLNPNGPHLGDLPNVSGGDITVTVPGVNVTGAGGLLDNDGAALVVHAQADDLRTDPSGNSGARIRCGVITPR